MALASSANIVDFRGARRRIAPTILRDVGLDPTREHQRRPFDYAFVAGAVIVGIALVLWAFFG